MVQISTQPFRNSTYCSPLLIMPNRQIDWDGIDPDPIPDGCRMRSEVWGHVLKKGGKVATLSPRLLSTVLLIRM